jgi:methionyl-tRNA synthetase
MVNNKEDLISIEEFRRIKLVTAKVLHAEKIAGSRKLVKLLMDLGSEQRTVVAGIGDRYEPEQLEGKTLIVVANLKPARLMGVESKGMVLAAEVKGQAFIATFEEEVPTGAQVI